MMALPLTRSFAQTGEIIYHDYEPDLMLQFGQQPTEIGIDLDEDGIDDMRLYWFLTSGDGGFVIDGLGQDVELCKAEEGDTISMLTGWRGKITFPYTHENYAVRIKKEEKYYYGWFRSYEDYVPNVKDNYCVDKTVFCTIPNYPLRWGQTDLYDDVEESVPNSFATVQPNPTAGLFTITGLRIQQIEIYDALGQEIASFRANGNQTTIDLSSQPAGVYLVSITDTEGRRCVKKVVRQ